MIGVMGFGHWYLSVAAAIYLICFARDAVEGFPAFRKATIPDVLRGIGGALIWPYIIFICRFDAHEDTDAK